MILIPVYKIVKNEDPESNNAVTGFLLVITWVDDCRYFSTTELVEEYEKAITDNCKCTMEGVSKEFVSIQLDQDINTRRTFEFDSAKLLG